MKRAANMEIKTIRTVKFFPPKMDLFEVFDDFVTDVKDGDIVCVSSKVVAIHQGRCVSSHRDKSILIEEVSEKVCNERCQNGIVLGVRDGAVLPFGGVDESNGNGYIILPPKDTQKIAQEIRAYFKKKYNLHRCGVLIVDSTIIPMRAGVIGISLASSGFEPVRDYVGKTDIFGRSIKMSKTNIADSLAAIAGMSMGEGNEQTPICILRDIDGVEFTDRDVSKKLFDLPLGDLYCAFLSLFHSRS